MTHDFDAVWRRISRHAGEAFRTITGLEFTYEVPGNYLRVSRTVRNLSRTTSARPSTLCLPTTPQR